MSRKKDWEALLKDTFENTEINKKAFLKGKDPAQMLIYLSSAMNQCGLIEQISELLDNLREFRPQEFRYTRGLGLHNKLLLPLKNPENWEETRADESVYKHLFQK